jgi:hypothetical protein
MSRIYAVPYTGTITAAGTDTDLLSVQPASNKPIRLRGWSIGQISEVGDAAEEGVRISIIRLPATFTVGTGGGAVTPVPMNVADAACGATVRCNDTTVATTSGTAVFLGEHGWNERGSPWEFWYPDADYCPVCINGSGLIVRLQTTLADDMTVAITFYIEEL